MIVVTGADGQLGTAFRKILSDDDVFLTRADLDLVDVERIGPTIVEFHPEAVINCAAYTAVDKAESDEPTAIAVNAVAVRELAATCGSIGARFVTFSTDYVFDGTKEGGYVESDEPRPINAYGRSKYLGERLATEANPASLIIRTSWLLSSTHPNFLVTMLGRLADGEVSVVNDQVGRPTMVDDLAPAILELMNRCMTGIVHLTNSGVATWYDLARQIAQMADFDRDHVHPCATADYPTPAARPANSVLDSERMSANGAQAIPDYYRSLERAVAGALNPE